MSMGVIELLNMEDDELDAAEPLTLADPPTVATIGPPEVPLPDTETVSQWPPMGPLSPSSPDPDPTVF